MKPRTQMEIYIANLKLKDHAINLDSVFPKIGFYTKNKINCMYCGDSNLREKDTNLKKYVCPACGNKLKLESSLKRTLNEQRYIDVVDAVDGVQVFRTYYAIRNCKIGESEQRTIHEVYRWYIPPKEKLIRTKRESFLMAIADSGMYNWGWVLGSDMEIRATNSRGLTRYRGNIYDQYPSEAIVKKVTEQFKYLPFPKNIGISTYEYVKLYLDRPDIEILAKQKQYSLIHYCYRNGTSIINHYKNEIITVIKNKYKVKDWGIWKDYIDLLKYFNKDTTSPRWCCPKNLNKEHDKFVEKKQMAILEKDNNEFIMRMSEFYNIDFGNKDISIVAFKDVYEVKHESNLLQHCAFKSGYHSKTNSLLLSARVNEQPIATIEIFLDTLSISQIRGLNNSTPKQYDEIKELLKKNVIPFLRKKNKNKKVA